MFSLLLNALFCCKEKMRREKEEGERMRREKKKRNKIDL
jgi:hypothetical protein